MRAWLLLLPLIGCAPIPDDTNPVYITQNPACTLLCLSTLGAVREDVRSSGAAATGSASLSQTTTTATGVVP